MCAKTKVSVVLFFFNSIEALQFTPRLKGVLLRVLPILGNIRDVHRPIFANGMVDDLSAFCEKRYNLNLGV